jgi:hypothetical protein
VSYLDTRIMLRICFKYNPKLLTQLCHGAKESLEMFFRTLLDLDDGILGMIMVTHTFIPWGITLVVLGAKNATILSPWMKRCSDQGC